MADRHLAAWGGKRIADMSRDELVDALNAMHRSYVDIARANMGASNTKLRRYDWSVEEADGYMRKLFAEEKTDG